MQETSEVLDNLVEVFKDKPYFYGVQDRENNGPCVVVDKSCNTFFVKSNAKKFNASYKKVSNLEEYLGCFSGIKSSHHTEYKAACRQVYLYLKRMFGFKIFENVLFKENNQSVSTIDFVSYNKEMLCIYKIALSKNHKKRKRHILARAIDLVERRFSQDYQVLFSYIAYVTDSKIEFQEKYVSQNQDF